MNVDERVLPVPAALRPWISAISVATVGGDGGRQTVLDAPDHATTLTVRVVPGRGSDLVVMGPRTRALYHVGEPGPLCVKARLRAGAARPVLGHSVRGLVDRAVPPSGLWGEPGERLADALSAIVADAAGSTARVALRRLEEGLMARGAPRQPSGPHLHDLVGDAAMLLSVDAHPRPEQVSAIARRLHVSERHLRDLFTDGVGISPKQYVRIDRVRAVLAAARDRRWAQLAADAGYYDQSHMTAEFRRIMGVPPSAFIAGALPAASSCGPPSTP